MKLIRIPLDHYKDVLKLLQLVNCAPVVATFDYRGRTVACTHIVTSALDTAIALSRADEVDALLTLLNALVVDQADQPADVHDTEDFAEEQNCVARLVSLMHADDSVDEQFQVCGDEKETNFVFRCCPWRGATSARAANTG